jgi:hypothetical protein
MPFKKKPTKAKTKASLNKKAPAKKAEKKTAPKEKSEKTASPPADTRFRLMDGDKVVETTSSLRLMKGESLSEGVERLAKKGWNIKDQAYVRQGTILKALAKRVKGVTRSLEPGKKVKVEYYDIIEADTEDAISDKLFDIEIEYIGVNKGMMTGKTDEGKFIGFPVNIVANTIPLDAVSEAAAPSENLEDSKEE